MAWYALHSIYSQEREGEYLRIVSSDLPPSGRSKSNSSRVKYYWQDKLTGISRYFLYGMMLKRLDQIIRNAPGLSSGLRRFRRNSSSVAGSHSFVKIFPLREKALGFPGSGADYGLRCAESFAKYDRDSRLWKTYQPSLLGDLIEFSETWPTWGTMRGGACWELMTPERPTTENESGYWRTPYASDGEGGVMEMREGTTGHYKLRDHVQEKNKKYWPTPNVCGGGNPQELLIPHEGHYVRKSGKKAHVGLDQAVKMFPTPRSCDGEKGTRSEAEHAKERARRKNGVDLPTEVMYPTTTVNDSKNNGSKSQQERNTPGLNVIVGVNLNPDWVELLMGFPKGWSSLTHGEKDGRTECQE